MKTRFLKTITTIAVLGAFHSHAQYDLFGKVNSIDGQALPDVKIAVMDTYKGAYTNHDGIYRISNLKPNDYLLKVSCLGYQSQELKISVKDKDLELNISMSASAIMLEEVQVTAVRADNNTPTTYSNIEKEQIEKNNFGQDLPYLLEGTPSTVVTSDAGGGVGYTGIRIRGVDPTRTNVTLNGIPLNDSESHGVYWVNTPDFVSSSENIQIQRGVGTSSNGAAAFGSSINVKTDNIDKLPYAHIDNAVGSFQTMRNTIKVGSGLINDRFALDLRLSNIQSNGYIDRASSDLKAYYVSGAWVGKKSILKAITFGGRERTYQAWYGVPEAKIKGNNDSLLSHFYNNYGSMYQTAEDSINLFNSNGRTYNYYQYKNQVDNYSQTHYQLHFTHSFSQKWNMNLAAHYTKGAGYYENYKNKQDLEDYNLNPVVVGLDTVQSSNLVNRKWLDNDFYGALLSFNYNGTKNLKVVTGLSANKYEGQHFGDVIWAQFASNGQYGHLYYDNDATKTEVSAYLKANYEIKKFDFFADIQVRHIDYSFYLGDEVFAQDTMQGENVQYTFINPKAGLQFRINNNNLTYASFGMANREPVRSDFIQSSRNSMPKPEQLSNLELGYKLQKTKFALQANLYLMYYQNQLILTGAINDVGAYNRTNVAKSFRNGLELEAAYKVLKNLVLNFNANLSQNKITAFDEYLDNYDNYDLNGNMIQDVIAHQNTDIAFSPNYITGIGLNYSPIKNLDVNILSKFVGQQYLDNTSSDTRKLDAYQFTNVSVQYHFKKWAFNEVNLGLLVNNVFNQMYENNGYTWSYVYSGKRITENFYYPQAGRNFMLRLSLKF